MSEADNPDTVTKKTHLEILREWAHSMKRAGFPVTHKTSWKQIGAQYHALALKHHPDQNGDINLMAEVNEIYAPLRKYHKNIKEVQDTYTINVLEEHLSDWGITPQQVSLHGDVVAKFLHDFSIGESYF